MYALCLSDGDHPESLQVRKVYQVVDDPRAVARGSLRIIDETGEDYLYPTSLFLLLETARHGWRVFRSSLIPK